MRVDELARERGDAVRGLAPLHQSGTVAGRRERNDQMTQFSVMRKATSRPGSKRSTSPWVTHSNSRCLLRLVNRAPSTGPPSPLSRTEETCGLHSDIRRTSLTSAHTKAGGASILMLAPSCGMSKVVMAGLRGINVRSVANVHDRSNAYNGRMTKTVDGRRARGDVTRALVAREAAMTATVSGLDSITVGGLAAATGVSKSGILTVFGSRENIQVAAVTAARRIFRDAVVAPAWGAAPGGDRLVALLDAWLTYQRDEVFTGGCFLTAPPRRVWPPRRTGGRERAAPQARAGSTCSRRTWPSAAIPSRRMRPSASTSARRSQHHAPALR